MTQFGDTYQPAIRLTFSSLRGILDSDRLKVAPGVWIALASECLPDGYGLELKKPES